MRLGFVPVMCLAETMAITMNVTLWAGLAISVGTCIALSWVDVGEHRLPNQIVARLAAGTAVWLIMLGALDGDLTRSFAAIGWGLLIAVAALALRAITHSIGMGDVKFAAPVAATLAWLGREPSLTALAAMAAAALVGSLVALVQGKGFAHRIPLGLSITIGLIVGAITYGIAP